MPEPDPAEQAPDRPARRRLTPRPGATAIPAEQLAALRMITADGTRLITLHDG
jgi:hypothetical protein